MILIIDRYMLGVSSLRERPRVVGMYWARETQTSTSLDSAAPLPIFCYTYLESPATRGDEFSKDATKRREADLLDPDVWRNWENTDKFILQEMRRAGNAGVGRGSRRAAG
jgi:hypothetical protein